MPEPKKVPFDPIPEKITQGGLEVDNPLYVLMQSLIAANHPSLVDARIKMMWRREWKPDRDGIIPLGMMVKVSDRERRAGLNYDAEMLLNFEWYHNPVTSDLQKKAVIDHELAHLRPVYEDPEDPTSPIRQDEHGNKIYYLRKHDVEDFFEIFERYGLYKSNVEQAYNRIINGNNPPTTGGTIRNEDSEDSETTEES